MTLTRPLVFPACLLLIAACETRQPLGLDGARDLARRTDTYGAPALLASFEYQALCNTRPFERFATCVGQPASVIASLPPVPHRITVRIAGAIQFRGLFGRPATHCGRVYPLGSRFGSSEQYFLRTGVYWEAPHYQSVNVPLEIVGGDSATVEGSVDVPAGGELYIWRQEGGYISSCHMVSPPPVVTVTVQEIRTVPGVRLVCHPGGPTTRGGSISCKAEVDPASSQDSLKVGEWSFEGRPRTDGDVTAHTWAGTMVTGGTVRVKGSVQGTPVEDSARIQVRARTWPVMVAASPAHDSLAGDLPSTPPVVPPTAARPFGYDLGSLAQSWMQRVSLPFTGLADSVVAGPNTGWSYVKAPLAGPYWGVNISVAFQHSSQWYQKQHWGPAGGPAHLPFCSRAQIDTLRMRAELHEGLRQTPLSHGDMYQPTDTHYTAFRGWIAANDPNNKIYEPLVWNADSLTSRIVTSADEYMREVWAERVERPHRTANEAAVDHVSANRVPINCRAR